MKWEPANSVADEKARSGDTFLLLLTSKDSTYCEFDIWSWSLLTIWDLFSVPDGSVDGIPRGCDIRGALICLSSGGNTGPHFMSRLTSLSFKTHLSIYIKTWQQRVTWRSHESNKNDPLWWEDDSCPLSSCPSFPLVTPKYFTLWHSVSH